jgi:hypothetical protein
MQEQEFKKSYWSASASTSLRSLLDYYEENIEEFQFIRSARIIDRNCLETTPSAPRSLRALLLLLYTTKHLNISAI